MIQALLRRLDEASIDATCTTEHSTMESNWGGELPTTIWITSASDLKRASQILQDEWANRTLSRCPSCGYDLRGHTGKSNCPECGKEITAATPEIMCTHCGESLPPSFQLCWSCGADVSPRGTPDA